MLQIPVDHAIIGRLEWIGLLDSKVEVPKESATTPLDAICAMFLQKLKYKKGEKDMIVMKHTFEVRIKHFAQILCFLY